MSKTLILFIATISFALTTNNSLKLSYQNLKFNNEKLGLLETSYLFHQNYLYYGVSAYSAVNGKRGGFFTGGIDFGIRYPFKSIAFDINLFLGGGGGGSAPQGSGLMSKTDIGIYYTSYPYLFGISYNKIKFKDGEIDSNQIAFNFEYSFKDLYFTKPTTISHNASISKITISPLIKYYIPNSKTTTNATQKEFALIGIELKKEYKNFNILIQTAGAFKGESDGYAEFLGGIEKDTNLFSLKALIGSGGGGRVDTKSGLIGEIETSFNFAPFSLSLGYTKSAGSFKAISLKAMINKKIDLITYGNKTLNFYPQKFIAKLYIESYMPSSTIRKNKYSKRADILNIDLSTHLKKDFYLLANAGAAINGESGGYAVGMFGIEYNKKYLFSNILIGAAGGGNIDVGGGLISKANIGINYKNFFLSFGYIKALNGRLSTYLLSGGIKFDFYKGIKRL